MGTYGSLSARVEGIQSSQGEAAWRPMPEAAVRLFQRAGSGERQLLELSSRFPFYSTPSSWTGTTQESGSCSLYKPKLETLRSAQRVPSARILNPIGLPSRATIAQAGVLPPAWPGAVLRTNSWPRPPRVMAHPFLSLNS